MESGSSGCSPSIGVDRADLFDRPTGEPLQFRVVAEVPIAAMPDVVESYALSGVFTLKAHGKSPLERMKAAYLALACGAEDGVDGFRFVGTREDSRDEQPARVQDTV